MRIELWIEIHRLHHSEGLSGREIAARLGCSRKTVKKALAANEAPPPMSTPEHQSILEPFHDEIRQILEEHPTLSGTRIHTLLSRRGYTGSVITLRRYLVKVRPRASRVYQDVEWRAGDAMQVDWGECKAIRIGETRRRVYVFVAVLCYSRMLYVEFTLNMKKEAFYRCIVHALEFWGGSPKRIIVDNLKAAVMSGHGATAQFHPDFLQLCASYHMHPTACHRRDPESKGMVEAGVRYVKENCLAGRALETWSDYAGLAESWLEEIANVRQHRTTGRRPIDMLPEEHLQALPPMRFDCDKVVETTVTSQARVRFDSNQYSVPPEYVRRPVVLRVSGDTVQVVSQGETIASHPRCYERGKKVIHRDHLTRIRAKKRRDCRQALEMRFAELGLSAETFLGGLIREQAQPLRHLRRLFELLRLYGHADFHRAIEMCCGLGAYDASSVENLILQERRRRHLPSPTPLQIQKAGLLEETILPPSDLLDYETLIEKDSHEQTEEDPDS